MLFVMMHIDVSSWTLAITARSQCQVWGELQHKDANYIPDLLPSFFCTQGCSSTEGVSRHHNAANTICNHWSLGVTMRGRLFASVENFLENILLLFSAIVIVPPWSKNIHLRLPQQGQKEVPLSLILVESEPCCKPCSPKPCAMRTDFPVGRSLL